jgi:hypothetical protein
MHQGNKPEFRVSPRWCRTLVNNKLTLLSSTLNRSTLLIHSMRIPSFGLQVIQCHGRGIDSLLLTRNLHMPSVNFMVARVGVL